MVSEINKVANVGTARNITGAFYPWRLSAVANLPYLLMFR
jgi:hypothetical protein